MVMGKKDRVFDPLPRDLSLKELALKDGFHRRFKERPDLSLGTRSGRCTPGASGPSGRGV